jgi:heme/copper-type cytochrome/quinol oxidase subunit 2
MPTRYFVVATLSSAARSVGLFSRQLKIDGLIEPGKTLEVKLTPQTPGTYTVICHHFCGTGHGNMKMSIVVE